MKTIQLLQGSAEWHTHRAQHFNASDAPAMMGVSTYKSRSELVREYATGLTAEVGPAQQRRFDDGHRYEALARPLAAQIIGEDLSPLVGVADAGRYSASYDGVTLMEDAAFEHKSLNDTLRAAMGDGCTGTDLPEAYQIQMEHQCLVGPTIERVLFMASKWADDDTLIEERHCWYTPDPALRARIVAGWAQFAQDVAAYVPDAAPAAPVAVGRAPEALPALRIEVTGAVTASNLAEFKEHALAVLGSINRDLHSDADFANAESTVKWAKNVEERLEAAKQHALSQTSTIDELFRTIDEIGAETRAVRLELDKLVKARKEQLRGEIVAGGVSELRAHLAKLNDRLAHPYMPLITADFGGAIKGKRDLDSMRDAVGAVLAGAKIAANETADRIQINLDTMHRLAGGYTGMFPDASTLVLKPSDDFEVQVQARVDRRKAEERAKADAERARIAEEERVKAEAKVRAEQAELNRQEQAEADRVRAAAEAAQAAATPAPAPALAPAPELPPIAQADTPAANEPQTTTVPTLRIGDIANRLGFALTAEQLRGLGIEPAGRERGATLFHEHQFPAVCDALARRAQEAKAAHAQRLAA